VQLDTGVFMLIKIKVVLLTVLATLLVTGLVTGAEKSAASPERIVSYSPNDVKIVGVLRYGQTSAPVKYSDSPRYRAFVFEGQGRDRVEITVTGASRNTFVAVADPSLNVIASGTGRLSVSLPDRGPDLEGYYVVFKDRMNRPARMSVQLKKTGGAEASPDATR
jgi:hypothetical protein